jgi:tRNA threonylcarbamoyladenosine biosynthesis protein TsaE
MDAFSYISDSESDTERLGSALAAELPAGTTVALIGTLGAGKTRLVQAVAAALGVPRDAATSPTFVLVNEYRGRRPVYHIDAYRLRDEDEFIELGPEEFFESDGLIFIEWADRVAGCLPPEHVSIHCEPAGETQRKFTLNATGAPLRESLARLAARLKG